MKDYGAILKERNKYVTAFTLNFLNWHNIPLRRHSSSSVFFQFLTFYKYPINTYCWKNLKTPKIFLNDVPSRSSTESPEGRATGHLYKVLLWGPSPPPLPPWSSLTLMLRDGEKAELRTRFLPPVIDSWQVAETGWALKCSASQQPLCFLLTQQFPPPWGLFLILCQRSGVIGVHIFHLNQGRPGLPGCWGPTTLPWLLSRFSLGVWEHFARCG